MQVKFYEYHYSIFSLNGETVVRWLPQNLEHLNSPSHDYIKVMSIESHRENTEFQEVSNTTSVNDHDVMWKLVEGVA